VTGTLCAATLRVKKFYLLVLEFFWVWVLHEMGAKLADLDFIVDWCGVDVASEVV